MTAVRRSADRKRRVLYQSRVAPHPASSTAAGRKAAEESRVARQPDNSFGSKVHRQLRGRWFSLVPVSRLALTSVVVVLLGLSLVLTVLHHLALTWPALADQEAIARPLRLDRGDSFAAWWLTVILLLSAGAARLIYVLRSHRRDDYVGHYQLWRLTLIVMLFASVHCTVGLVSWMGGFMDLMFGERAVLSGANWLRIAFDIGGIVLGMRLVAEVHRCRPALIAMIASAFCFGFSEAASWHLMRVDSVTKVTAVLAAPMLGATCFLVASTVYLRAMFRQVRNIADPPSMRERYDGWKEERRQLSLQLREEAEAEKAAAVEERAQRKANARKTETPKREVDAPKRETDAPSKQERRKPQPTAAKQPAARKAEVVTTEDEKEELAAEKKPGLLSRMFGRSKSPAEDENESTLDKASVSASAASDEPESEESKPKRRWFGLRAAKPDSDGEDDDEGQSETQSKAAAPSEKSGGKRRFSLRLKPQRGDDDSEETATDRNSKSAAGTQDDPGDDDDSDAGTPKKGWFGGLFRRKPKADQDDGESSDGEDGHGKSGDRSSGPLSRAKRQAAAKPPADGEQDGDSDDWVDTDEIDWSAMSKSERRRMRKRLKRSGQAA